MNTLIQVFQDPRLGDDLLWRELRVPRFSQPVPALFLDRDGVIIHEKGYISKAGDVELLPGISELISGAKELGLAVVEITNQAGIARGHFGWPDFVQVEERLTALLADRAASIDAIFACPYHPDGAFPYRNPDHAWRKPNAGMFFEAAKLLNLALDRSVMVGDKELDQQAAKAAKLRSGMHVLTGYGKQCEDSARSIASEDFRVHVVSGAGDCLPLLKDLSLSAGGR
jgi:D-glycero-D-manno-heptose 1,7-bisphosphate phosphatase